VVRAVERDGLPGIAAATRRPSSRDPIVAAADEPELLSHCRTYLPEYAVPAAVRRVDHLRRSSVGKPLRRELARCVTGAVVAAQAP